MRTLEDVRNHHRALVLGVGGGGDVVGAIPTARFLELMNLETILGGLPWERVPTDPHPGPRPLDHVENLERVTRHVGLANGTTRTRDGAVFTESLVAEILDAPVALLDITPGPAAAAADLAEACRALDVDLVVGVDAGGDALAAGPEAGLRSPLADAVMLAVLTELETPTLLGVIGWGSDGELGDPDLMAGFRRAAERGGYLGAWGVTPQAAEEMERVLAAAPTEASRLPVEAARGKLGDRVIRRGKRSVQVTPQASVTYLFDPAVVAATSDLVPLVRDAASLEEADRRLLDAGYRTELQFEREWAADQGRETADHRA